MRCAFCMCLIYRSEASEGARRRVLMWLIWDLLSMRYQLCRCHVGLFGLCEV